MNGQRSARRERRSAAGRGSPSASGAGAAPDQPRSGHPYRPPRLRRHGRLTELTGAAEGTVNDGAGGFFAFSGAAG